VLTRRSIPLWLGGCATAGVFAATEATEADSASHDLKVLLRRVGIVVPAERWPAVAADYVLFRGLPGILREP